jgi:glycosyltransferase involved in cell wall biosynthesis
MIEAGDGRLPFALQSRKGAHQELEAGGVPVVKVLPNGVDTAVPLGGLPPKPLSSPLRWITVSRLTPTKRIDHAVSAVAAWKRREQAAELMLVGGGECDEAVRRLASELQIGATVTNRNLLFPAGRGP